MAEAEKKNFDLQKNSATLFKIILGLAFIFSGALAILRWWSLLLMFLQACIGLFLILAGIITLAIAKE